VGGAVAFVMARVRRPAPRRAATAAALVAVAALTAVSWSWFAGSSTPPAGGLAAQRSSAATVQRILRPGESFYSLGDPAPLVMTRRRNPSRFVYLSSGVAQWEVGHTRGRLRGWERRLLAARPGVVMVHGWHGPCQVTISNWLGSHFERVFAGNWAVFVTPRVRARARRAGIPLRARSGGAHAGGGTCGS
jgi:hypothetical protein